MISVQSSRLEALQAQSTAKKLLIDEELGNKIMIEVEETRHPRSQGANKVSRLARLTFFLFFCNIPIIE